MRLTFKSPLASVFILFSLIIGFTFADGLHQEEQGAASTAQGGAIVARANNLSAIYFNPAGITQLAGTQVSFGTNLILPSSTFSNSAGKWEMEDQVIHPTNIYFSHKFNEQLSFGFGYYRPFAYSSKWDSSFTGRFITQEFIFKTYYTTGVVAYQITPEASIAVGVSYVHAKLNMSNSFDLSSYSNLYPQRTNPEGFSQFDASTNNIGINVGFLYKIDEFWTLGATYRSAVDLDFSGNFNFSVPNSTGGTAANDELNGLFPDQIGSLNLKMPHVIVVGLSTRLIERTSIEADIRWSGWSDIKDLAINYSTNTAALEDRIIDRQWKNTFTVGVGAEFEYNPTVFFRGGYCYRNSAIPGETLDPMVPDALSQTFSGGVGLKWNKIDFDAAYAAVFYENREEENEFLSGLYENFAHIFSFSLTFKF